MECLQSSAVNETGESGFLTSAKLYSSLAPSDPYSFDKMETENYVKLFGDGSSHGSDASHSTLLNGCVKNLSTQTVGNDEVISNNNAPNAEGSLIAEDADTVREASPRENSSVAVDCVESEQSGMAHSNAQSFVPQQPHAVCCSHVHKSHVTSESAAENISQGSSANLVKDINSTLNAMDLNDKAVSPVKVPSISCDSSIQYIVYESECQMEDIMRLITKDLSEPYSIYTYRYFIHNWPRLCFLAMDGRKCVGAIVCKLDRHRSSARRGYIAMLAVDQEYRHAGIGSSLVVRAIKGMIDPVNGGCDEVVLETEITNSAALRLYEKLGFVRDKRLFRYYLNGVDALRLKLWLK